MLYPDEAWHNWYFNKKEHPETAGHREKCYDCMDLFMEIERLDGYGIGVANKGGMRP